ncbi:MAG: hypothetical protein ACD_75C00161G0004 [uncultured bacterium]|nr:MAG: hypothetical protein ACD_75C00161G0004 [uncultured bacterium]
MKIGRQPQPHESKSPCDLDRQIVLLRIGCWIHMMSKEDVYAQIKKTGNLPTLPEILIRLLEACDDDSTPLAEISSVIRMDPALSFQILQLVNSSYYGLRSQFTAIENAVVYLGANSIKNIALTTSIHQVFDRRRFKAVKQFNLCTFWWNSLMAATLAKRLAKKTGFGSIEEAYLSGLLLDIGRLVLVSTFPREHESILLHTEDSRNELWAEKQLIGVTHGEAGSWLIQNWKLNSMMADAIQYHHESLEKIQEAFPLVKIVYVANLLMQDGENFERHSKAGDLLLGLDGNNLMEILDGANEEVSLIAENLKINAKPPAEVKPPLQPDVVPSSGQEKHPDCGSQVTCCGYSDAPGHSNLAAKIKNIALVSGFFEKLIQAGDREAIITVFEQSMSILFEIEKVLLFLPDEAGVLLKGRTSATSSLQHLSTGLILPIQQSSQKSSSLIVKSFLQSTPAYLTAARKHDHLADEQIYMAFRSATVLLVPITAEKNTAGVILLGLPESIKTLSKSDYNLIQAIARQVGLCLCLEDMRAKKAAEIEAERMAAISMTARKLAHEINNPLGIINNYLTTMQLKLSQENTIQEELGIIGEEINRISLMVSKMGIFSDTFSHSASHRFELTDINAVIEDIVHIVKTPLFHASGMTIAFHPDVNIPRIMTSGDALKQVMINLIKNASEAMSEGQRVGIKTGMASENPHEDRSYQSAGIEIVIEDTGPGLPETILKNLYKPFVTTKKNGTAGLGLSIVHKTVNDLGGLISCSSKPGEGTSFRIRLPLQLKEFS